MKNFHHAYQTNIVTRNRKIKTRKRLENEMMVFDEAIDDLEKVIQKENILMVNLLNEFVQGHPELYDPKFAELLSDILSALVITKAIYNDKKKAYSVTVMIENTGEKHTLVIPVMLITDPDAYIYKRKEDVIKKKETEKGAYESFLKGELKNLQNKVNDL